MDLKIMTPVDNAGVQKDASAPVVFVAIVEEGAKLPEQAWATIRLYSTFQDLVIGQTEDVASPTVIAVPDTDQHISKVRLVCDNVGTIGIRVVQVKDLTPYVPSPRASTAFWGADSINWGDWQIDAEEALRTANIAQRATLDVDERKLEDAQRADGSVKKFAKAGQGAAEPVDDDFALEQVTF